MTDDEVRLLPLSALALADGEDRDSSSVGGTDTDARLAALASALPARRRRGCSDVSSWSSDVAAAVAALLYPSSALAVAATAEISLEVPVSSLIKYEQDRRRLRHVATLQERRRALLMRDEVLHGGSGSVASGIAGTRGLLGGVGAMVARVATQGPFEISEDEEDGTRKWRRTKFVDTAGVKALPMPVQVASADDLDGFFRHLWRGGGWEPMREGDGTQEHAQVDDNTGFELHGGAGEPGFGTQGVEFRRGVVYADGRMDLCKQVVGPDHIGALMDSLRGNTFVRHFLLGNNIIGPLGAREVASFVRDRPNQMETWYLAGNCIDGASFTGLVDALTGSSTVTGAWFKRNPLGPGASADIARLVTRTPKLRTLDLDQTELGDAGVAELFDLLAAYDMSRTESTTASEEDGMVGKLPLRHIYLSGTGMSAAAAAALARFLRAPPCGLTALYLNCNPLGDTGAMALASGLASASTRIERLSLQSVGLSSPGASALFDALAVGCPGLRVLDIGQQYATEDLAQAYNYVEDGAVESIVRLVNSSTSLQYLRLGPCALTPRGLRQVQAAVAESTSLLVFEAQSIVTRPSDNSGASDSRSGPSTAASLRASAAEDRRLRAAVRERLEANVIAAYGPDMTYARFLEGRGENSELRWLISDRAAVRVIDSVYRNRDASLARRSGGRTALVKRWADGDDTLDRVMEAAGVQGPVCTRRRTETPETEVVGAQGPVCTRRRTEVARTDVTGAQGPVCTRRRAAMASRAEL